MSNEWNGSYPVDHTKIGDVPGAIRTLKTSAKAQFGHEHEDPVDGDATGSEHKNGSAVCYIGTTDPTDRPDGATALANNDIDDGRLWLDDTASPATLKRWKDSAFENVKAIGGFTPAAYAGEESITLPNGLIIKHGKKTLTLNVATVTYDAAFPTGFVSILLTPIYANGAAIVNVDDSPAASNNGFSVVANYYGGDFYWMAIGY